MIGYFLLKSKMSEMTKIEPYRGYAKLEPVANDDWAWLVFPLNETARLKIGTYVPFKYLRKISIIIKYYFLVHSIAIFCYHYPTIIYPYLELRFTLIKMER